MAQERNIKDIKSKTEYFRKRKRILNFDHIVDVAMDFPRRRLVVAPAEDPSVLEAVCEAAQKDLIGYTLVGNEREIIKIAKAHDIEIDGEQIYNVRNPLRAIEHAVRMMHEGGADILMKGYIHTDDFLRPVLNKEYGLRGSSLMSHVFVLETKMLDRLIFITDCGMNIEPDLVQKTEILLNAVHLANIFGVDDPKVAVMAAVEVVNPSMPATIDAATIAKIQDRRQFSAKCVVDGPLALDNAVSEAAAKHKKIGGPVAGKADILLVPDIEAGNVLAKSFVYFAGGDVAGVVVGAKAPIVLTSRADNARSKLYSIATAVLMTNYERDLRLKIGRVNF